MLDAELFAIRVGCLQLLDKVHAEGLGTAEDQARVKEIAEQVMRRISASPIVTEEPKGVLVVDDAYWSSIMPFGEDEQRATLKFSTAVTFNVHWPRKNQELFGYSGRCFEDFTLTYDGSIYTIAARCEDLIDRPYSFYFGREGHRILASILAPSSEREGVWIRAPEELWDLYILGPSPMYPIYYVAAADDPSTCLPSRELMRRANTLESFVAVSRDELSAGAIDGVLRRLRLAADVHYDAMTARVEFWHHHTKLGSQFEDATTLYQQIVKPVPRSPRKLIDRITSNRRLRESVGLAYKHYAQMEEARASATMVTQQAADAFSGDPLLDPNRGYTAEHLADVFEWKVQHIMEGLRFFAEESRSRSLESATLIGPLMGGLIAIAATALALLLT